MKQILILVLAVSAVLACPPRGSAADGVGSIEGTIIYRRDSKRRWRYARYYIKDAKQGHLAEAVVALRSSRLRRWKSDGNKPRSATVDQKNFRFIPETVAIQTGASVSFRNSDRQVHNVRSAAGIHPFNISMPPGTSVEEQFKRAGGTRQPVLLGCSFHSSMRGWIFVFRHPFFQVTDFSGRFRFDKVPAGSYTLEMRHPAGELRTQRKVVVVAGKTAKLDIQVTPDDKVAKD